jgi:hypothetical protein
VLVFDARTGRDVLKAVVDPRHLDKVRQVHLLQDRTHYYLAFEAPPDPAAKIEGEPWAHVQGLQTVPVSGMLYAFDRDTGKALWYNRVPHQHLIVDRLDELPILLFAATVNRQSNPPGNNVATLSVMSIDKRTGKRLYGKDFQTNPAAFHAVQVDPRAKTIDLVSQNLRVRHTAATK